MVTTYLSGTYLAEPLNVNGTPSIGASWWFIKPGAYNYYLSAAVQYLVRAGGLVPIKPVKGMTLSIGARMEGVPVNDLIGGSDGFRRPGHTVYIEPGLIWNTGRDTFSVYGPVPVDRRRDPDSHGNKGDATFPGYILLFGYIHRFGK